MESSIDSQMIICHNDTEYTVITKTIDYKIFYRLSDIGKLLGLSNIHKNGAHPRYKVICRSETDGGLQKMTFVSHEGLKQIICKSRQPCACEIAKHFGIDALNTHVIPYESSSIMSIVTAFKGETFELQYRVDQYRIDLYFPKIKLAVECDESHHFLKANIALDIKREEYIISKIGCRFLRYSPTNKDFDIFKVINDIYILFKSQHLIL